MMMEDNPDLPPEGEPFTVPVGRVRLESGVEIETAIGFEQTET